MAQSRKHPELECARTVTLIGMMGAGKTTVGRRLAARLELPFFDADQEIEKAAGMSVADLFATHGEESFRDGEAKVIRRLLEGPVHVLATGGGAITNPETRALIRERSVSVWIKVDVETVLARAGRRSTRPLLQTDDPRETVKKLIEDRKAYYEAADIHVESQSGPHGQTAELIIQALKARPDLLTPVKDHV